MGLSSKRQVCCFSSLVNIEYIKNFSFCWPKSEKKGVSLSCTLISPVSQAVIDFLFYAFPFSLPHKIFLNRQIFDFIASEFCITLRKSFHVPRLFVNIVELKLKWRCIFFLTYLTTEQKCQENPCCQ